MARRTLVNSLVALVAVLLTSAIAAVAVISGPPSSSESTLVATELDGRASVRIDPAKTPRPEAPTVTTVPTPTTRPRAVGVPAPTVVPPSVPPVGGATVPPTTSAPPTTAIRPVIVVPPVDVTPPTTICLPPVCFERRPPPEVAPSWTVTENGVTVTARIEPAAPQVGDSVTIFYTATADGDVCCWTSIFGPEATLIHDDLYEGEGCPAPSSTSAGSTTVEMTRPATFEFYVSVKNGHPCQDVPVDQYPSVHLTGSFWVNPLA